MTAALVILGGYLLGSMPFGYWVILLVKGEDIRKVGSGNIGATNVWRAYGRWYGIPIVLLDVAKGFVPGLVGTLLVGELVGVLAGGAAMLGHWRPLFLRFQKGGKTVATAGGTFFGVATTLGLIGLAIWIVTFLVTRYASLASLVTALSLPFLGLALGEPWPVIVFASIAAVAVVLLHKENIARLRAGTESRFALRRGSAAAKSS
jgi:acyl phosphate:glycerol-3-phosphate acyltransferase